MESEQIAIIIFVSYCVIALPLLVIGIVQVYQAYKELRRVLRLVKELKKEV